MKKIETQLNRVALSVEKTNSLLVQVLDVNEKRLELHSKDIYEINERFTALEEYLGIKLQGKKVDKKKYIKI